MSENRLHTARELINEKQYELARKILETLQHNTTAQSWLKKLDEIAPQVEEVEKTIMTKQWRYCRLITVQDRVSKTNRGPITWQVGAIVLYFSPIIATPKGNIEEITTLHSHEAANVAESAFYRTLAELGEQGWEVIDFSHSEGIDEHLIYRMRIQALLKREES